MKKHKHYTNHSRNKRSVMLGSISQKYIITGLAVVILLLVVLTFFVGSGQNLLSRLFPSPTPTPASTSESQVIPTPTPINGDSILYTGLRFTPQDMELTLGQVVNIANLGDSPIEIATDDTAEEARKLNLGLIEVGDTSQFIEFRSPGVYTYYDRANPENGGRIIVKEQ